MSEAIRSIVRAVVIAMSIIWVFLAISLAIDVWSDQCVTSDLRCTRDAPDRVFAGFQLLVAFLGSWFLFRRRWRLGIGMLVFWVLVPFFFFSLGET